jgi:geranylgeranyl pyrophosphate synthase
MLTSIAGDYVTLTGNQTAMLLSAAAAVGFALVDGDFGAVIRIVAEVGGIPIVAVTSIEKVIGGDLRGGAEGLIPLAIEAMSPTLAEVITSMAGEYVTLTSDQTAMLLSAATRAGLALADGDFTGVV